jgi:ferredoxin
MSAGTVFLSRQGLEQLIKLLWAQEYRVIGPRVEQGTILYHTVESVEQLPWGYSDIQQPGSYRLRQGEAAAAFRWANGPQALKPFYFAPQETLWQVEQSEAGLSFSDYLPPTERLAIIGARACDLAALAIQDQHFLQGVEKDRHYARRREHSFIVAVNCSHPAGACFCAATGDGPNAESGYDLLLDEIDGGFIAAAASDAGNALLKALPLETVTPAQSEQVEQQRSRATQQQRSLPQLNLHGKLMAALESPHWEAIAERCLACGNCTAVCPTCFCHSEHEVPSLDGAKSEHLRQWDSCFSQNHSYIHGIVIRADRAPRYRQWLTHKFDNWHEQFGRSGCVGCGRCISWCPVGIDVTEELAELCGGEG